MPYAEFAPVQQSTLTTSTTPTALNEPIIIDVPKTVAPAPAPTSVHLSYPFKQTKDDEETSVKFSFLALFLLVWIIAGIVAFVMSLVCFARGGSAWEKIAGFLLALFFGPFYWIYYLVSKSYCAVESATQVTTGGKHRK